MPVISEILEVERVNTKQIHLFREGLFLKAYQRSAYLFHTQVKPFKAVKKFYKTAGEDVVMLGFPSKNLTAIFPELAPEPFAEDHVVIDCVVELDEKFYTMWLATIPHVAETKRKTQTQPTTQKTELFSDERTDRIYTITAAATPLNANAARPPDKDYATYTKYKSEDYDRIIEKIKTFSLENATPLECMLFLSGIKKDINDGYGRL